MQTPRLLETCTQCVRNYLLTGTYTVVVRQNDKHEVTILRNGYVIGIGIQG